MAAISDMQAGKAGEYLVCADLITQGFIAFPSEQGLPYDVVVQGPRRLVKVQVKAMRAPVVRGAEPPLYSVTATQRGKGGRSRYKPDDADVFAIVALDEKKIGYFHLSALKTCMEFRSELHRGLYMSDRFNAAATRAGEMQDAGVGLVGIAEQMGVSTVQVKRYLLARKSPRAKGKYLSDFPFAEAIKSL